MPQQTANPSHASISPLLETLRYFIFLIFGSNPLPIKRMQSTAFPSENHGLRLGGVDSSRLLHTQLPDIPLHTDEQRCNLEVPKPDRMGSISSFSELARSFFPAPSNKLFWEGLAA